MLRRIREEFTKEYRGIVIDDKELYEESGGTSRRSPRGSADRLTSPAGPESCAARKNGVLTRVLRGTSSISPAFVRPTTSWTIRPTLAEALVAVAA